MAAVSSIIVFSEIRRNLSEVSTTKHKPNKLDEALRMCGDLWLLMFFRFAVCAKLAENICMYLAESALNK